MINSLEKLFLLDPDSYFTPNKLFFLTRSLTNKQCLKSEHMSISPLILLNNIPEKT